MFNEGFSVFLITKFKRDKKGVRSEIGLVSVDKKTLPKGIKLRCLLKSGKCNAEVVSDLDERIELRPFIATNGTLFKVEVILGEVNFIQDFIV